MLRYFYCIFTLTITILLCFKLKKSKLSRDFASWPPLAGFSAPQASSCHCTSHCLFFVLQKTDAPIFFLYIPCFQKVNFVFFFCFLIQNLILRKLVNYSFLEETCKLLFEVLKHRTRGKKLRNYEHLKNQSSILGDIKNIFHNFLRTFFFWWNIKK